MFAAQSREGVERIIATTQSALQGDDDDIIDLTVPHTLEEYAIDYFRVPKAKTLSGTLRGRKKDQNAIWAFSRDPIKKPLLKRLCDKPEEIQLKATQSHLDILKNHHNMMHAFHILYYLIVLTPLHLF